MVDLIANCENRKQPQRRSQQNDAPIGPYGDDITTCFQEGIQLVEELWSDDLQQQVEQLDVRQPGDQHQRLQTVT